MFGDNKNVVTRERGANGDRGHKERADAPVSGRCADASSHLVEALVGVHTHQGIIHDLDADRRQQRRLAETATLARRAGLQ